MAESAPGVTGDAREQDWHQRPVAEVLERLRTRTEGLSESEARERLARYGPNALRTARPVSAWRILVDQVQSVVVLLLFFAAGVALMIGDLLEAAAIGAVLLVNIVIGFWTEWRARQAMESLRQLQVQAAVVVRDGKERTIDARELVPGDLIQIEAGSAIPADARLVNVSELRVVEAPLTGESVAVDKTADPVKDADVTLADRTSMVYKGTMAAVGAGRAVVVGTGRRTEIGRVAELVEETESDETPLEERLDALGRRLVWVTLAIAAVVASLGLLRGEDIWLMVETGVALAIAAVPEGLPVVATVTLAVGLRRMARRNALVRRLPAVETLGSATIVCTDKTGTLTAGEMTVTAIRLGGRTVEVTGGGYAPEGRFRSDDHEVDPSEVPGLALALRIGVLANRARVEPRDGGFQVDGDPTEAALLVAGRKAGLERGRLLEEYPEVGEVPFSSERMLMATFHRAADGETVAFVKGAPGRIAELSTRLVHEDDGPEPLDQQGRRSLLEENRRLAGAGLRVLAVAYRELDPDEQPGPDSLHDLTFVGLFGLLDPAASGVKETIRKLREAGVRTVMITGDQAVTAEAVARDLGLLAAGEQTLEGRAMSQLSDGELVERAGRTAAFSRVNPEDKLRIVQAYQGRGDIVGMLGDGVNDAPALKRANIGVAMGRRGTDVAKETADVVLQDDRFETVALAVEQGRVIFDNIRKFIFYLFSCNLSEVLVLFVAGIARLPLPLLPLQILWLNLITDVFPALALAMEPPEADVMRRSPRDPESTILSNAMMTLIGGYGVLLTVATLGVFLWGLEVWGVDESHAVTLAFMTLALTQLFHVFNARSTGPILFTRSMLRNPWVWGAIVLTVSLQIMAVYMPLLSQVLHTHPLRPIDWGLVLAGSLLPLVLGQLWKIRPGHDRGAPV